MTIRILAAITLQILLAGVCLAQDSDWRPVTGSELGSTNSEVERDADAEVIFWEVRVQDDLVPRAGFQSVLEHYIRIKIYTDRGREENAKVDIPFGNIPSLSPKVTVSDIAARTTRADGSIFLLDPKDIFEREIIKGDGLKVNAKSFVVPGIETGAVIEYKWKEVRRDYLSFYVRLQLAREIPVRLVKYYLKPVSSANFILAMRVQTFNTNTRLEPEGNGFYSMTVRDVRSFREEPFMPPEYDVRPWLLVYYTNEDSDTGVSRDEYWENVGRTTYEYHKSIFKKKKDISQAAAAAVGDASETLEKVRRIFLFCRNEIRNLNDDALGLSPDDKENIKENKSESDTLKRRQGYRHDINQLFAAMLNAAGIDVRIANVVLRSNPKFNRNLLNDYFLEDEVVAVDIDGIWHFMDPSTQHLPFGMLHWAREGQPVLLSDRQSPIWMKTPEPDRDSSRYKRTLRLRLDGEGLLQGEVSVEFSGHPASVFKENLDDDSASEREKSVIEYVKARISSSAEITDVKIENVEDPEKPLVYRMKIDIPDLVTRTGRRMFLKPNVFAANTKPLFPTAERRNNVFFQYPWSEEDEVVIELPEGLDVEIADPPASISDSRNLGSYSAEVKYDREARTLTYRRRFAFGKGDELEFDARGFSSIKALFDSYFQADQYTVTLVRRENQ